MSHPTPPIQSVDLAEARPGPGSGIAVVQDRMAALKGVKARVSVYAGSAETTIAQLLDMKSGAVLELDRHIGAGFSVVLEDKVIAVGELVAVGDKFGLRITELAAMPGAV